jgi:hypothetical protein
MHNGLTSGTSLSMVRHSYCRQHSLEHALSAARAAYGAEDALEKLADGRLRVDYETGTIVEADADQSPVAAAAAADAAAAGRTASEEQPLVPPDGGTVSLTTSITILLYAFVMIRMGRLCSHRGLYVALQSCVSQPRTPVLACALTLWA